MTSYSDDFLVKDLPLPTRARNALTCIADRWMDKTLTVGDVRAAFISSAQMLRLPNFGKASYKQVLAVLPELGERDPNFDPAAKRREAAFKLASDLRELAERQKSEIVVDPDLLGRAANHIEAKELKAEKKRKMAQQKTPTLAEASRDAHTEAVERAKGCSGREWNLAYANALSQIGFDLVPVPTDVQIGPGGPQMAPHPWVNETDEHADTSAYPYPSVIAPKGWQPTYQTVLKPGGQV